MAHPARSVSTVSMTEAAAPSSVSAHARDPQHLLRLGRRLIAAGDFAGARRPLVDAMMLAPTATEPCVWLARATLQLGDSYRALRLLRRAIRLGAIDDQVAELYARAHLAWEQKKKTAPPPFVSRQTPSQPPPPQASGSADETAEDVDWEALLEQSKADAAAHDIDLDRE